MTEKPKPNFNTWAITTLSFGLGLIGSTFIMGQQWGGIKADMIQIRSAMASEIEDNKNVHPLAIRNNTDIQYLKESVCEIKNDIKTILKEIRKNG